MAEPRNYQVRGQVGTQAGAAIDEGLRSYMLRVYNLMAMGLVITGVAAYAQPLVMAVVDNQTDRRLARLIYGSPLRWVVMLAPLGLVFFLSFRVASR